MPDRCIVLQEIITCGGKFNCLCPLGSRAESVCWRKCWAHHHLSGFIHIHIHHSMKSPSSALCYSPLLPSLRELNTAQSLQVASQGCTESLKYERWQSPLELLYCTSPNQTQHCPVSHITTSLVRLSLIHARLLMVDILTDISWSFSFWVVLIALEKLKQQLCLNCSKLCIMLSIYPLHDTWLSYMQPAG